MNVSASSTKTFQDLCDMYKIGEDDLWTISHSTGVPKSVIDVMHIGSPVGRADAMKVLSFLSNKTGSRWTLENTSIPVIVQGLPTFKDICDLHRIDTTALSRRANIDITIIDQMSTNYPVKSVDAIKTLDVLSNMVEQRYTINNVAMNLSTISQNQEGTTP